MWLCDDPDLICVETSRFRLSTGPVWRIASQDHYDGYHSRLYVRHVTTRRSESQAGLTEALSEKQVAVSKHAVKSETRRSLQCEVGIRRDVLDFFDSPT